jgi:Protein of unknown function (DUF1203)
VYSLIKEIKQMTKLAFIALQTDLVRALQHGSADANGKAPEEYVSDGSGLPCRHCLSHIDDGEAFLIVAHRPFTSIQPYAEQGPIFLHAKECPAYQNKSELPPMFKAWDGILLRGYSKNERIVYGTGQTVTPDDIEVTVRDLFATKGVAFVHARSATNNCYQFRIELTEME